MEKEIIMLNGEPYRLGDPIVSKGIDMKCYPVLCTGGYIDKEGERYFLMTEDGLGMWLEEEWLTDYFVDTPANRARILKECKDYMDEYNRRVEEQLKRIREKMANK